MATAKEILEKAKRQEEQDLAGADVLTPKQALLDASTVQDKLPDKRLRWVNLRDAQKVESRKAEGYSFVPPESGGRRLGDELALMEIPRERYERKVARQEQMNKERLEQHNREMEAVAESVAKILRDKHGVNINAERILVKEG